jgi:hypothetical protein
MSQITNKLLYRLLLVLLFPLGTWAHPGIGIVKDSKGAIYYTDLKQVWKIAPDGKKHVVVPGVHTHELYIDSLDRLFGEHLWYNGERLNTWGHYVWRLDPNGALDTVNGPEAGFLENYSFVRDAKGNMYWVERYTVSRFKKKAPDGSLTTLAEGKYENVKWLHVTTIGVLYFLDQGDLYKIDPSGKTSRLAKDVSQKSHAFAGTARNHMLFGVWTDKQDNVYVANYSGQVVKRVKPDGTIENMVYSKAPWAPTGGVFDDKGNLWVLECSFTNDVRVRKVGPSELDGQQRNTVVFKNYLLPFLIGVSILVMVLLLLRKRWRRFGTQAG